MIHAFNQKNVRRLLVRSRAEHGLEKTEDAVTSMVFSPLDFMSAADALEALCTVTLHDRAELSGRRLLRHDLQLWPSGLTAKAWNDDGHSRCEPDLLAKFEFADGPDLVFIGEMKWDWRMPKDALGAELRREREAVRRLHPRADLVLFVISKHRLTLQQSRSRSRGNPAGPIDLRLPLRPPLCKLLLQVRRCGRQDRSWLGR